MEGDCLEVMASMEPNTFTSIVSDPPYGLSFMGKEWDHGLPGVPFWTEALRVTKPGGMLLAFGGTRTYHRLTCAIEDAGWEIRDCLMHLYGTGFPKSHNISKALAKKGEAEAADPWDGWGTALKPAWEPVILAMKPLDGTFAENALKWGVGGLNIDGARIGTTVETWPASRSFAPGISSGYTEGRGKGPTQATGEAPKGRWPANVTLDDFSAELLDEQSGTSVSRFFHVAEQPKVICNAKAYLETWNPDLANTADSITPLPRGLAASVLRDAVTSASQGAVALSDLRGLSTSVTPSELRRLCENAITQTQSIEPKSLPVSRPLSAEPGKSPVRSAEGPKQIDTTTIMASPMTSDGSAVLATFSTTGMNTAGGAKGSDGVRFRYVAKASRKERNAGLDGMEEKHGPVMSVRCVNCGKGRMDGRRQGPCCDSPVYEPTPPRGHVANHHPTVKPVNLMRHLVKLVTMPEGTKILDPFLGSGTTGIACVLEGVEFVGIEKEPEYAEIARRRIAHYNTTVEDPL